MEGRAINGRKYCNNGERRAGGQFNHGGRNETRSAERRRGRRSFYSTTIRFAQQNPK